MNPSELSDTLVPLITSHRLQEAIDSLLLFVKTSDNLRARYMNECILISARYSSLQRNNAIGIVSSSEAKVENNRITKALLELVVEVSNHAEVSAETQIESSKQQISSLKGNWSIQQLLLEEGKIRILIIPAGPDGLGKLRLQREVRSIEDEIVQCTHRDRINIEKMSAPSIRDLRRKLMTYKPHFVHFSGHGNEGGIALVGEHNDEPNFVPSKALSDLFKLFSDEIACIFFNSCYSESQTKLMQEFIPNLVGMNEEIGDDAAIEFARTFYGAVGEAKTIKLCFDLAKNALDLSKIQGADIPILL